jgi:REP element-mobilizing transposase RayT
MPRQPRLDAPGALHHVIGRGIEKTKIFRNDEDRIDFINRLSGLVRAESLTVYGWALMSNHYHLLVRTGHQSLSSSMRSLLTGYVVNFNRRNKRYGHLFQNRYKSIICEDDPYLLELTRYIHLNPLRAGIVKSLSELKQYCWSGHSILMGGVKNDWQDVDTILSYFGKRRKKAVQRYEDFIRDGISQGRRLELTGGGLVRSAGGWSQVLSLRKKVAKTACDDRILGGGNFVEQLLNEADDREKQSLRLSKKIPDLEAVADRIARMQGVSKKELLSGCRKKEVVKARKIFCQGMVKMVGYSGAEVARFLGLTTSAVNKLANTEELPEVDKIISC